MTTPAEQPKNKKRQLTGTVVRKSGAFTVAVEVARRTRHPLYSKIISTSKRYLAHDPAEKAEVGQTVTIVETRPLSKRKRWLVV